MNNKKYLIIGIVTTLILCLGVSVAYFTGIIRGEGKNISVSSKKLEVIFTDTEVITASNIEPGWSKAKTFSVENKTGSTYYYDINIENLVNTFELEYLEYKITSTNGYNMTEYKEVPKSDTSTTKAIAEGVSIPDNTTQTYTIEFRYRNEEEIDQNIDQGKEFKGRLSITEHIIPDLIKHILADNPVVLERTNFDSVLGTSTATDNTIYKASGTFTEDGSEVYYFAGNVSNNWVKFGQDENNNDLYWRIIRTNEDGGVRLLYAGISPDTTREYIEESSYNSSSSDTMYVGYMYGSTGSLENNRLNTNDSIAKTYIDDWYSKGLNIKIDTNGNTYDKYISKTAIYCNDRSGEGYASGGTMTYAASNRFFYNSMNPSYKCGMKPDKSGLYSDANIADKFTVSKTTGNGDLTYPVALMTADEVVMAGGHYSENEFVYYYLNANGTPSTPESWFTMSPARLDSGMAVIYTVGGENGGFANSGGLYSSYYHNVDISFEIRPVLSLKSCATYKSGNGIATTPYEVSIDSACATAEN